MHAKMIVHKRLNYRSGSLVWVRLEGIAPITTLILTPLTTLTIVIKK